MQIAVYPGTFDPITNGHTDLIERIDKDLREILAEHQPEPLPDPIREKVRAIHGRFEDAQWVR